MYVNRVPPDARIGAHENGFDNQGAFIPMNLVRILASHAVVLATLFSAWPAHAQWWNLNDHRPPKFWHMQPPPKIEYTHRTVRDAASSANAAFWNDDFAKLDRMYDEMLQGNVRAADGTSMLQPFQEVFEQAGSSPVFDKTMERWAQASPDSRLRPLAQAVRWEGDAWRARGGSYSSQVPGESMQLFTERLARAAKALAHAEPEGRNSPIWYWVALIVAGSSGRPDAQFDALFAEAAGRFPYYQPLYYTRVNYLLPQWGGSFEAVDKFVNDSVARTSAGEGEAFYAWLYMDIAPKVRGDLFETTLASWPRMKKGFEDMLAHHPDVWNKNLYATWACRARDKETTARLLVELGDRAKLGAASEGITTESCRRFASSMS